jgi:hypothetical protein
VLMFRSRSTPMRSKFVSSRRGTAWLVALSGGLYLASFVITAPAADLRYALWPTIAAIVAIACALSSSHRSEVKIQSQP